MSRQHVATESVRIIHAEGTEDEATYEEVARIQPKSGLFDVQAPIHEGDVVEVHAPDGGPDERERRVVAVVRVNDSGPKILQHTQVIWGQASERRVVAPVRVLALEDLHERVREVARDLLVDGRYGDAVREALASLKARARALSDGHRGAAGPLQEHEEEFFASVGGLTLALGVPEAEASSEGPPPQQALEQLALVSLLHRRLDLAEPRRTE